LWDAHAAGAKILELTDGRSFEEFAVHPPLQEFATTMIGIMGDALRELQRLYPAEADAIREAKPVIAFADGVAAGSVEPDVLWKFLRETLPALLGEIRERLEQWHQA
jgi:uncharacterized protein with HEPN domain